jgi:hypothetical protein
MLKACRLYGVGDPFHTRCQHLLDAEEVPAFAVLSLFLHSLIW